MSNAEQPREPRQMTGFMARLRRDQRGNTMAIMAAALIPLAGMVGGGVDIARMYIVKTRLQHACDAGALAGRKAMGGGTWNQTVNGTANYPNVSAQRFFDANYQADAYGASNVTKTFTENAGKVSGTASATLPMTLMQIFGRSTETLSVTCDAEMRLPNTDIMFVLDTTGSMGDTPSGDSITKLASLKIAVKCFYEIVARLDSNATCTTGTPSGGTGDQVQIRFGFVPYATNVNVGKLLPTSYFANTWSYQSRESRFHTEYDTTWTNGSNNMTNNSYRDVVEGSWTNISTNYGSWSQGETWCSNQVPANTDWFTTSSEGSASNVNTTTGGDSRTTTWRTDTNVSHYDYQYNWRSSDRRCIVQRRTTTATWRRNWSRTDTSTTTERQVFDGYFYGKLTKDISGLKNGTSWNNSFQSPLGTQGANTTVTWGGCIEERATTKASSYYPIPADAKDLDIDLVPSQSDPTTLWAPVLPAMIYTRNDPGGWWGGSGYWSTTEGVSTSQYVNGSQYFCPTEARKLQQWNTPATFDTYVDSLTDDGNTYHDIGLLWGARLASPTGIFANENAYTPQGGEIERHIIFMTDGDPCTGVGNYTAYGVQWFDRRQTDANTAPTDGCTTTGTLTAQVNARTAAICSAIKNKNITLWVITFGTLSADTVTRMTACATPGRYFNATNAATIQSTFKSIADQISQLRLTK